MLEYPSSGLKRTVEKIVLGCYPGPGRMLQHDQWNGIPCYGPQPDFLDASGIIWYRTDCNAFATLTSSQLTVLRGTCCNLR